MSSAIKISLGQKLAVAKSNVQTYLDVILSGKALNAKQAAALTADLAALNFIIDLIAEVEAQDPSPDLSTPSRDTAFGLEQLITAYNDPSKAPATGPFSDPTNVQAEIVQRVAEIVGGGTAQYKVGDVSPEALALARFLNSGASNRFSLTPVMLASLTSGEPEFARSLGLKSESIVA